jgi:photosystem I P700 chlorophyll a apoprotein A1
LILNIGQHRDLLLGHLAWVSISLGFHSFGLYLHNDIFQALGLPQDLFHDLGCQLKPVAAAGMQTPMLSFHVKVLERKLLCASPDFGTADLMVHHVHAFGLHVTTLILAKAILYAGTSRLVSSKASLGFRSPCDGPGRGGTCQISAWDHVYLAAFWLYNALSVVWFHYFWKMQSEVWGTVAQADPVNQSASGLMLGLRHISGDFSLNPHINAWLGGFLWAQAAQVIQSYASSLSGYGFLFISAHFLWAFSLMFLFSGRGYWQEFIESLLWAHVKLKLAPAIQARALSISQGRAAGLSHSALGGIGCSWAFFLSRMLALV